jgi:hypothetical protein
MPKNAKKNVKPKPVFLRMYILYKETNFEYQQTIKWKRITNQILKI